MDGAICRRTNGPTDKKNMTDRRAQPLIEWPNPDKQLKLNDTYPFN